MTVSLIDPENAVHYPAYHHVAVGTGSRQVFIAGQVSRNAQSETVAPGDLAGQVTQALRNIGNCLEAAGGSFRDVLRITYYVVGWNESKIEPFTAGLEQATRELDMAKPPFTVIGVQALYTPDLLVEAEANAVID